MKTGIATLLSLLAAPCFSGLYVGAGVGPEGANFTQRSHVLDLTPHANFNVFDAEHFAGTGVFGSLFAGYGWTRDRYYLAGEVNANLSSVKYKLGNDEVVHNAFIKTTMTVRNSLGISVLPGYFLSKDTLFYGRIGYTNGRLKVNESDPTILSSRKHLDGLRYGLGLRHDLNERWTMMMDYSQINYRNVRSFVFEPFGGVAKYSKIRPDTAQVAFGVLYNFDVPQKAYVK